MKRNFLYLAAISILVLATTLIIGCKKDKLYTDSINTTETRKPIAVFNQKTGVMTNMIDIDAVAAKLNKKFSARDGQERYVVESVQILDSVPTDPSIKSEIKIVIIDTEEEVTYTTWLMECFSEKEVTDQMTNYYIDEDVEAGVYDYAFYENDKLYVVHVNGSTFIVEEQDPIIYNECKPKWTISCRTENCDKTCEKTKVHWCHWTCTSCTSGSCNEGHSLFIEIVLAILNIF